MPETAQPLAPAIERAAALYHLHGGVLARDLEMYLRHPTAQVIKSAEQLILFRPIVLDDPARWLELHEAGQANAWFIRLLIGTPWRALREMPHSLPYCCWHRNFRAGPTGRLHVVETDKLIATLRRLHHGR